MREVNCVWFPAAVIVAQDFEPDTVACHYYFVGGGRRHKYTRENRNARYGRERLHGGSLTSVQTACKELPE